MKTLLGVIADPSVPDSEIDAYVAAYVTPAADEGEEDQGPKYEFAETPAGTLRYAKRGDGAETVILIHGFGGDLDNWLFNIDALAEKATVYALDLPGHGQSTKKLDKPGLAAMTTALVGLHGQARHRQGASRRAIRWAAPSPCRWRRSDPAKVKSLTLICSAGLGPEIGSYVDEFVAAQGRKDLKPVLEQLFADKSLVSRQLVDDVLKYKRLDGVEARPQVARRRRCSRAASSRTRLPRSSPASCRRRWSSGARRTRSSPPPMRDNLPGAKVHVLEGAGHMVFMEKASDVNNLIKAHIAG